MYYKIDGCALQFPTRRCPHYRVLFFCDLYAKMGSDTCDHLIDRHITFYAFMYARVIGPKFPEAGLIPTLAWNSASAARVSVP
mgnify:CR=1 FL=1